jgi:peptidoglycan-associated lipoprotein
MHLHNRSLIYISLVILVFLSGCSASRFARTGKKAYDIGEYQNAIDKFMKASRKESDINKRTEIDYYLAKSYWNLNDYMRAELRLRNLIRREYPDTSLVLYFAHALRNNEKYEDAIEYYQQYLDAYPENREAINGIESCKLTPVWKENPTRFEITHERLLNSRDADFSPWFVSGLDNQIIFTSTRDGASGRGKSAITGQRNTDLFRSSFNVQRQRWDKPVPADSEQLINTQFEEGTASLSSDGNIMYFTRCKFEKSSTQGAAIYTASKSRDSWSDAENLRLVSDSLIAAHPSISHDGLTLYFVSDMEGGYGGLDIWKVEKMAESWGEPKNLGPEINTPGDEMFPFIRDNGELYFSSDYHVGMGGLDIFKATYNKENQKWIVENMKSPVNSTGDDFGIAFIPGRDQGMFSSNRKGSLGDDLYSFMLPPKIFRVEGEIVDSETDTRVRNANVRVIGTDGTMLKVRSEDGKFQYRMAPETEYIFAAFKDGYLNSKQIISTNDLIDSKNFNIALRLSPTDAPVQVNNINYEFGKHDLLPESITALDSLIDLLNMNPSVVVEIMSHTDHIGSVQFNFDLSQRRAQSVVNYLIQQGINPKRLVAKGYGKTWPKTVTRKMASEHDFLNSGDVLTEEFVTALQSEEQQEIAKAINRRTEFRVLSTDFRETYSNR